MGNLSGCNIGSGMWDVLGPATPSWRVGRHAEWNGSVSGSTVLDLCSSSSLGTFLLRSWNSFTGLFCLYFHSSGISNEACGRNCADKENEDGKFLIHNS